MPQVEVTFEIDANGILHVSAKDKDTGAEQSITITDTTTLDQSEVERMIADAERNRADDARLRQEVDARNELDAIAYQVEHRLADLGDAAGPRAGEGRDARRGRSRGEGAGAARPGPFLDDGAPAGVPQPRRRWTRTRWRRTWWRAPQGEPAADDDVIDADFTVS